jgi:crotonobetainyl-CoA:carnitine CoA-transferase CaiB-like acyl-CoA transferase
MWHSLKVVELASVLAGPLVGTFFAELGAQVLKIENKTSGGDVTRTWRVPNEDTKKTISAYYASANYGKKSIFLDLKNGDDFEEVMKLIATADIVIQNFKKGDAEKLGLDAKSLREKFPNVIVASISGFGEEDDRMAFDVVLQAETGFMAMNGSQESGPIKMPVALIDVLAAHHLKEAILIALLEKAIIGIGKIVHVSLYDAALASLANQASAYLMEGHIPKPMGTLHPSIAPYGDMFETLDGKLFVLAVGSDTQFKLLCSILNIAEEEIGHFSTNPLRVQNRTALQSVLADRSKHFLAEDLERSIFTK